MKKILFKFILLFIISLEIFGAKSRYSLGIGVTHSNNYIGNETSRVFTNGKYGASIFPAISLKMGKLTFNGLGAKYDFLGRKSPVDVSFNMRYFGPSYKNLTISKRSPSFFAGPSLRLLFLNIRYNTDLSSKSNGAVLDSFIMYPLVLKKSWILLPKIGLEHFSENFINYYYGVSSNEAVIFPQYSANKSFSLTRLYSIGNVIKLNESLTLRLILTYRKLSEQIANSPIVNGDDQFSTVSMLLYNF